MAIVRDSLAERQKPFKQNRERLGLGTSNQRWCSDEFGKGRSELVGSIATEASIPVPPFKRAPLEVFSDAPICRTAEAARASDSESDAGTSLTSLD